jgi:signal transduction histidine kinase/HD-GYP domain-containing protein (c-di-GMP phosphodiesterase class II)
VTSPIRKLEPKGRTPLRLVASLGSLSFAVQSAFDTHGLVTSLADSVLDLAQADQFALLLLDYETGELEGHQFERGHHGPTGHTRLVPAPASFLGRVVRRDTLIVEDPTGIRLAGGDDLSWRGGSPETMIGVPVVIGTSLLGVAVVGYRRKVAVTDRRRRVLLFLADQIGLAVDRIRTHADLETKRRKLEEAAVALRRLDEAKSDLISIVSHELRTPLTAIKAYTETLLDNLGRPSFTMQEKFLGIVNEECDRLSRIVNDVLDLSRMESGRRRLKVEPVALGRLIEEVTPTVAPELGHKRLHLVPTLERDLPSIEADPDLLKQVLVNLIANAAKFSRPNTDVVVRAGQNGERMNIAVEDHGMGIAPDKIGRVFERFYRVEESGAERVGGTGLGLAIVKSVVELHGGTIRVESVVGQGSRFVMDLPLRQHGFRDLMRSLGPFFERPELLSLLQNCVEMVAEVMEARIVSLMFCNEAGTELLIQASHGLDADMVARTRVKMGDSIAGWVAQTSENLCVTDIENDRRFRKMNHPQYETKSLLCVPLKIGGETVGVVNVNNKTTGVPFDTDDLNLLVAIGRRIGQAVERVRAAGESGDIEAMIATVRAIVRARRSHLLPTSRRGFKLAADLGRLLKLDPEEIEILGYVAKIHDVGMLSVGEDLLLSDRRWTEVEHRRIEGHPQAGVQLLKPIEIASRVNGIILSHHEHFDGRGYPRGLKGEEIPLGARILAVVDAYESMTAGRPYREPFTDVEAVAELKRCAGTQFDPRVVQEFVRAIGMESAPDQATARPRESELNRDAVR